MLAEYTSTHSCYYSPLLDPSPVGNYPEWDEGHTGTEEATGDEDVDYEDQSEIGSLFGVWDD